MKDQKGMSLVTLLITIVILLILAGVAIAMLSTSGGEITKIQNIENEVINRMGMAYSVTKSNAELKMATIEGYSPIGINEEGVDYGEELAKVVAKELGLSETDVEKELRNEPITDGKYHVIYNQAEHTITMIYGDEQFSKSVNSETTNNTYSNIKGVITLTSTEVNYTTYPQRVFK